MDTKLDSINSVLDRYAGVPVLVLGGSGFIGRWVARLLTCAGAKLYLPARDCAAAKRTFAEFGVKGEILKLDLLQTEITRRLVTEIDPAVTFNLAGYGVDRTETSQDAADAINVRLVETVANALADLPASSWRGQQFVHAGTAMEYGSTTGDLIESSLALPTTLYGRSKLAGTQLLASICREASLRGVTARLFAVYGPGEPPWRLLPSLVTASVATHPVSLTAGLHRRDFTYVEEVAEALLRLGLADCRPGEAVNVATGVLTPIRSFVQTAASALGISSDRLQFGALETRLEEMDHDPVNCDRLMKLTGWRPQVDLELGIRKTLGFGPAERVELSQAA